MENKRGLSQVVTTVLLILIVLTAVTIIWAFVRPTIEKTSEQIGIEFVTINMEIIGQSVFIDDNNVSFKVKRNPGKGNIIGLKVVLEDIDGKEKLFDFPLVIEELETVDVFIDYSGNGLAELRRISIAPVFENEVIGNVVDVYVVSSLESSGQGLSWPPTNLDETKTWAYEWNYYRRYVDNQCTSNMHRYPEGGVDNIVSFFWLDERGNGQLFNGTAVAQDTNWMPQGKKALFSWWPHRKMHQNESDFCTAFNPESGMVEDFTCAWWDNGTSQVFQIFDDFFADYKAAGGELDVFVLDYEVGMSRWSRGTGGSANWTNRNSPWNGNKWIAMEEDVRFGSEDLKGSLVNLGYYSPDYPPDFLHINDTVWQYGQFAEPPEAFDNYLVWNSLMHERVAGYKNAGIYEAVKKHYPDVIMTDYNFYYWSQEFAVPNHNGHRAQDYGNGAIVGTHQNRALYGELGQITNPGKGPGGIDYADTAFNAFRYDNNKMRAMKLSRPDVDIIPWIGNKGLSTHYSTTDYYQENILHAGLVRVDEFKYFNACAPYNNDVIFSNVLKELDEMVGYDVETITLVTNLTSWTNDFVYTGMEVGDYRVWRFTPDNEVILNITSDGDINGNEEVRFKVGDGLSTVDIVFPNAVIYYPENPVSSLGYWVLQFDDSPMPFEE